MHLVVYFWSDNLYDFYNWNGHPAYICSFVCLFFHSLSLQSEKILKIRVQQTTSHLTVNVIILVFTLPKQLCYNNTFATVMSWNINLVEKTLFCFWFFKFWTSMLLSKKFNHTISMPCSPLLGIFWPGLTFDG